MSAFGGLPAAFGSMSVADLGSLTRLEDKIRLLQEDLESERELRNRIERERADLSVQLIALTDRLEDAEGTTDSQIESNRKREAELQKLRKLLEESQLENEDAMNILRKKHQDACLDYAEQIEQLQKKNSKIDRERQRLQHEVIELTATIDQLQKDKHLAEKAAERFEAQTIELSNKVEDLNRHVNDLAQQRQRLQAENNDLLKEIHDQKVQLDNLQHVKYQLAQQLNFRSIFARNNTMLCTNEMAFSLISSSFSILFTLISTYSLKISHCFSFSKLPLLNIKFFKKSISRILRHHKHLMLFINLHLNLFDTSIFLSKRTLRFLMSTCFFICSFQITYTCFKFSNYTFTTQSCRFSFLNLHLQLFHLLFQFPESINFHGMFLLLMQLLNCTSCISCTISTLICCMQFFCCFIQISLCRRFSFQFIFNCCIIINYQISYATIFFKVNFSLFTRTNCIIKRNFAFFAQQLEEARRRLEDARRSQLQAQLHQVQLELDSVRTALEESAARAEAQLALANTITQWKRLAVALHQEVDLRKKMLQKQAEEQIIMLQKISQLKASRLQRVVLIVLEKAQNTIAIVRAEQLEKTVNELVRIELTVLAAQREARAALAELQKMKNLAVEQKEALARKKLQDLQAEALAANRLQLLNALFCCFIQISLCRFSFQFIFCCIIIYQISYATIFFKVNFSLFTRTNCIIKRNFAFFQFGACHFTLRQSILIESLLQLTLCIFKCLQYLLLTLFFCLLRFNICSIIINGHFKFSNFCLIFFLQTNFCLHTCFSISCSCKTINFKLHILTKCFHFFLFLLQTTFHFDAQLLQFSKCTLRTIFSITSCCFFFRCLQFTNFTSSSIFKIKLMQFTICISKCFLSFMIIL
uniref:Paramyosin n=1 Tax=Wuchereria bancrofti TaxID=6293 RepID=H2DQN6_WUCBA|nr:paramyosin [Wuchereria bancrofti]